MKTKVCTKCHKRRLVSRFREHYRTPDHLNSWCKNCESVYQKSPARKKASNELKKRIRHKTNYREAAIRGSNKHRAKYPEKSKARIKVQYAIRNGKLERPNKCSKCGQVNPRYQDGRLGIHAHHHNGYKKALDVKWLCYICHRKEHLQREVK